MKPQNTIELAKTRDFSDIINDTFLFVRENFKPLVKCFFVFCGFFMVAGGILTYLQQMNTMTTMTSFVSNPDSFDTPSSPGDMFARLLGWQYLALIVVVLVNGTVMCITVISYMAIYKQKGNQPATTEEVWGYIKYYFFRIFGSSIVLGLLLGIATLLCIIPGVWLYPIISLMFPIMIVENAGLSYAFNQGFRIIKNNWWATFGALVVMILIVMISEGIITIPFTLLTFGSMFLQMQKHAGGVSPVFLGLYAFCIELCRVLYILPMVTLVLCYFSLNEIKEGTGLMEKINQMGKDTPSTDLPAEEY